MNFNMKKRKKKKKRLCQNILIIITNFNDNEMSLMTSKKIKLLKASKIQQNAILPCPLLVPLKWSNLVGKMESCQTFCNVWTESAVTFLHGSSPVEHHQHA